MFRLDIARVSVILAAVLAVALVGPAQDRTEGAPMRPFDKTSSLDIFS